MKTFKLLGTGGIAAVCAFLLFSVSCKPVVIVPPDNDTDKEDSTAILPPQVSIYGLKATGFVFRLFSPDSVDLFAPNTGSKYNFDENEDNIWLWFLIEKKYLVGGGQGDTLRRFYAPNLDNPKWIFFKIFKEFYPDEYGYNCTGDFNVMSFPLINAGYLRAEHSTMYIQWDTNDFDTIYTTFRKQVEGTPEFPYGYYTFDSIWYNGKLAYTWERFLEDYPCTVPIIIKENP